MPLKPKNSSAALGYLTLVTRLRVEGNRTDGTFGADSFCRHGDHGAQAGDVGRVHGLELVGGPQAVDGVGDALSRDDDLCAVCHEKKYLLQKGRNSIVLKRDA